MKLVIGNQKTYLDLEAVEKFIDDTKNCKSAVMCPSSIYLDFYKNSSFELGAQNVSIMPNGTTTGEVSASQLQSMGVKYCLVGHSERRQMFKETGEDTNKKLQMLLTTDITPVLCVGETREERNAGKTNEIVAAEISEALTNLSQEEIEKIVIAYEPIWAISDGKNPAVIPTNPEIDEISVYIKDLVMKGYNAKVRVLYGGSVNMKNIDELNKVDTCDGYLVGGACIKPEDFGYVIDSVYKL